MGGQKAKPVSAFDSSVVMRSPIKAETVTEEWLRSSQPWDAVTQTWLDRLEAALPCRGCHMSWPTREELT